MIYEVEFTCKSREAARVVAKQLIHEHVLANASITPCDYLSINSTEAATEVEEQYLVKVKALTTAPKYLMENYSLSNFVAKSAFIDGQTAKKVADWCNEGYEVPKKTSNTWREERARILKEQLDEETEQKLEIIGHPEVKFMQTPHSIGVPAECTHHEITDVPTDDNEDEDKKKSKLPKWAEEEGLTLAEYKRRCNERTAARWGITYQEYSKLAAEARKSERPLKEYFEEQGLCYSEDISEPEDEFDDGTEQHRKIRELRDTEIAFASWLQSVGLPLDCTVNTVFKSWCDKYGLTQNQRIIMNGRDKDISSNFKSKLPQWAEKLGLTIPQYNLVNRIGVAAQWGATLRDYDECYNISKENGTTIENELAARFAKSSEKNLARHIANEYRQMMNFIDKFLTLYQESEDN